MVKRRTAEVGGRREPGGVVVPHRWRLERSRGLGVIECECACFLWRRGPHGRYAPGLAHGQQSLVRVAIVRLGNADQDITREPFMEAMRALGYVEGRNIVYELRYAGNDSAVLRQHMQDVVRLPVDVIMSGGTPGARAARDATQTIPIVLFGCPTRSWLGSRPVWRAPVAT